ncbi:unnamed protein product [Symbiodinium sp. CCMP2592]|nr:unnamed protein product [Symbiodinium sp. CCMP2592]
MKSTACRAEHGRRQCSWLQGLPQRRRRHGHEWLTGVDPKHGHRSCTADLRIGWLQLPGHVQHAVHMLAINDDGEGPLAMVARLCTAVTTQAEFVGSTSGSHKIDHLDTHGCDAYFNWRALDAAEAACPILNPNWRPFVAKEDSGVVDHGFVNEVGPAGVLDVFCDAFVNEEGPADGSDIVAAGTMDSDPVEDGGVDDEQPRAAETVASDIVEDGGVDDEQPRAAETVASDIVEDGGVDDEQPRAAETVASDIVEDGGVDDGVVDNAGATVVWRSGNSRQEAENDPPAAQEKESSDIPGAQEEEKGKDPSAAKEKAGFDPQTKENDSHPPTTTAKANLIDRLKRLSLNGAANVAQATLLREQAELTYTKSKIREEMPIFQAQESPATRKAWRTLLRKWHPDKNPNNLKVAEQMTKFITDVRGQVTKPDC